MIYTISVITTIAVLLALLGWEHYRLVSARHEAKLQEQRRKQVEDIAKQLMQILKQK